MGELFFGKDGKFAQDAIFKNEFQTVFGVLKIERRRTHVRQPIDMFDEAGLFIAFANDEEIKVRELEEKMSTINALERIANTLSPVERAALNKLTEKFQKEERN